MEMVKHKPGPRHKFKDQLFWAEGGLVCIEDQRTGNFKAITRLEAAARALAFNLELPYFDYPDERDEMLKCIVGLCECVKEARRQGDPTDPEVRKHLVKDHRKVSVLMDVGPSSVSILDKDPGTFNLRIPGSSIGTESPGLMSERFKQLKL